MVGRVRTVLLEAKVNMPFFFETHFSDEKVKGLRCLPVHKVICCTPHKVDITNAGK